ncbi:hypothetical protein [Geosporobacter ferrireducens]|uniref:hypothetical protein n=1 Tax=Geosporobacter ferrireducens TaxID=1424294 RepID=UPI0012EA74B3|nr:hypothetical protein [Geosporobacter ferrireducens]
MMIFKVFFLLKQHILYWTSKDQGRGIEIRKADNNQDKKCIGGIAHEKARD